jgi:hypothetical protein
MVDRTLWMIGPDAEASRKVNVCAVLLGVGHD